MRTRAAVLTAIGSATPYAHSKPIAIEELEFDAPGPGEVVVRIASAGLCHSDLSNLNGTIPKPTPLALGHEAAGIVEQIGAGVTQVKAGDHVVFAFVPSCGKCDMCISGMPAMCVPGHQANFANALLRGGTRFRLNGEPVFHHLGVSGFAERTVCAEESLIVIPDDVPLEFAAVFGCGALTGLGAAFNVARIEPYMTVAIFGAGGVGLMALIAAIACGARTVVVDPLEHKRKLATELGATFTVDPTVGDPATQINDHFRFHGVHYAIEATGIPAVVKQALLSTGPGGTAIALGVSNPKQTFELAPFDMLRAERTLRASFMGASVPRRDVPRYIQLWRAGKLPVEKLLSGTIGLEDLNGAFDRLAAGDVVRQMVVFPGVS
jgi:alcohol dehydrogenase